jgi:hypothetical protein
MLHDDTPTNTNMADYVLKLTDVLKGLQVAFRALVSRDRFNLSSIMPPGTELQTMLYILTGCK